MARPDQEEEEEDDRKPTASELAAMRAEQTQKDTDSSDSAGHKKPRDTTGDDVKRPKGQQDQKKQASSRKRRASSPAPSSDGVEMLDDHSEGPSVEGESKRERRCRMNRRSAKKKRAAKMEEFHFLRTEKERLTEENERVREDNTHLRERVALVKSFLPAPVAPPLAATPKDSAEGLQSAAALPVQDNPSNLSFPQQAQAQPHDSNLHSLLQQFAQDPAPQAAPMPPLVGASAGTFLASQAPSQAANVFFQNSTQEEDPRRLSGAREPEARVQTLLLENPRENTAAVRQDPQPQGHAHAQGRSETPTGASALEAFAGTLIDTAPEAKSQEDNDSPLTSTVRLIELHALLATNEGGGAGVLQPQQQQRRQDPPGQRHAIAVVAPQQQGPSAPLSALRQIAGTDPLLALIAQSPPTPSTLSASQARDHNAEQLLKLLLQSREGRDLVSRAARNQEMERRQQQQQLEQQRRQELERERNQIDQQIRQQLQQPPLQQPQQQQQQQQLVQQLQQLLVQQQLQQQAAPSQQQQLQQLLAQLQQQAAPSQQQQLQQLLAQLQQHVQTQVPSQQHHAQQNTNLINQQQLQQLLGMMQQGTPQGGRTGTGHDPQDWCTSM